MPMNPGQEVGLSRRKEIPLAPRDSTPVDTLAPRERAHALPPRGRPHTVDYDVAALVDPDIDTVGALARLQLAARRLGRSIRLRHASRELQELLSFAGLSDVLPCRTELLVEAEGQAEEREETRGVEEEGDPGDPTR